MKQFWLHMLLILAGCCVAASARAQVGDTDIRSDTAGFSTDSHRSIYEGHVRLDDPKMKLTCAWLVADLPSGTNYSRHIVATTNVVMDLTGGTNGTWHVTCDQAVYDFKLLGGSTNETVTLTGHARAESEKVIVLGEPLVFDMVNHLFTGTGSTETFKHPNQLLNSTNGPGPKTNTSSLFPGF
jgi:lipopolysaccharide export system protein LptA